MTQVFRNDFSNGEIIEYETSGAVSSGDPMDVGGRVGIALTDAGAGDMVSVKFDGVVELPKAGTPFNAGDLLDWTGTEIAGSGGANGFVDCFIATKAAASGDATAYVMLNN